jgi:hypothetical protein
MGRPGPDLATRLMYRSELPILGGDLAEHKARLQYGKTQYYWIKKITILLTRIRQNANNMA